LKGLEFYKCKDIILYSKPPKSGDIPITEIESCGSFYIKQSVSEMMYMIKTCGDVKGVIVNPLSGELSCQYQIGGKLFWEENESSLVCLSTTLGFISVPVKYELNNISQHVLES
jgi:hypothetical protein